MVGRYPIGSGGDENLFDIACTDYNSSDAAPVDERYVRTPDISKGMPANGGFYPCQLRPIIGHYITSTWIRFQIRSLGR